MSKILQVSHSSLTTADSCWRKFEFNKMYAHPKRVLTQADIAAEVGHAMHKGVQNWLTNRDEFEAMMAMSLRYPHEICPEPEHDRSWEACMATMEQIMQGDELDGFELAEIVDNKGVTQPAVEVPFAFDFIGFELPGGYTLRYAGYIDAIMRHKQTGLHRTFDIKTHRDYKAIQDAKYMFNTQQIPYGIAIEHVLQKEIAEFEIAYYDCFIDVLEPKVELFRYRKTQEDIQDWLAGKVIQIRQLADYLEMDWFRRNESGCAFYNKACKYLELCSSRNKDYIQAAILMGEEAEPPRMVDPWIHAEIPLSAELIYGSYHDNK